MALCDFSSIIKCLKKHIDKRNSISQPDLLHLVFHDFFASPEAADVGFDEGLICRWMNGYRMISPKIRSYYTKTCKPEKFAETLQENIMPLMADWGKTLEDINNLFMQDFSISNTQKEPLECLYKSVSSQFLFLAKLIVFGMNRPFNDRTTENRKLIAGVSLSPVVLDYIMGNEVPRPCRHFLGREKELDELHATLEENSKVFLSGIAGIGKSELAKAYAKQYKKNYTNILYVEYTGDLHQNVTDMDFADDLPAETEKERFQRHNRFLRALKDDTLLIIDNFNTTATQDKFLPVILKYQCRILFTTRSEFKGHSILQLKEIRQLSSLFQLASAFYMEAEEHRSLVEAIIETVHRHTFAVELAAKLLKNGILPPEKLLKKLQEEKASLENEDKISAIKDGQTNKATYYNHIHTLFSLYTISQEQQEIMRDLCFLPPAGISARIFAGWLELTNLNDINDLIETGFVQANTRHSISLHPMIQEIALSETKPAVTTCHNLLNALERICLMHGTEVSYYKKLFQTVENIMQMINKDDPSRYLLFIEDVFPQMEKYHYLKGMKAIIKEMALLLTEDTIGADTDRALLLDYQACIAPNHETAIKLEKEALAKIKVITEGNIRTVSNLHMNLGSLYRLNSQVVLAREHMERAILLLEQYQLCYNHDIITHCLNYAVLLTDLLDTKTAFSVLQKLAHIIKETNSDTCLDYAQVQESMGNLFLLTANLPKANIHYMKALEIYKNIWNDDPNLIKKKYQEIQGRYLQAGFMPGKKILDFQF